ncbi:DUF2066 domain-containing protein [Coxiella-like endosymbiont]|uniref:DUF2066 domain-containing protein n=1 Tax=Coxiella-like endosymbiont TaxID=1592897 RepID=UPI00272DC6BC|nr:DUF2066 domain-containing protein [Coxiella-like endosymbiont]
MAIEVRDISIATIAVSDQSHQTFQKSLPQALEQVLVRMSGNVGIMTLPVIQDVLPKINNYVEKYSYLTKADEKGGQQLLLRVVFDKRAMKHFLENANQAIWSARRPLTIVWVSVPNGSQSETLASESQNPTIRTIKQVAFLRGLPIIFPAMDLEDQTSVAQSTSTLLSNPQLQIISQRYGVNSILAGAVVVDANGQLQGEWQLFLNGTPYEWQTTGTDVTQVITNGIDRAADMMANQFATFVDGKGMENLITMEVTGVQTLNDYVHVVSLLKHLSPVMKVSVSDMNADMLLLKIKTSGNLEDLVKALKSTSHLIAEGASSQPGLEAANLFYRWKASQPVSDSWTIINFSPFH